MDSMEAGARGYDLADDHPGSQDIRIFQDSGPGRSNSHSKASRFVVVASWFQISDLHAGRKLGQEIHGPEDEMIISKDHVLFYENLKSDGKVSQSIEQYKKAN